MPPRKNGWYEVDRNFPCPLCGAGDWCGYNDRGVVCMRRSDMGRPTRNGGIFVSWKEIEGKPPDAPPAVKVQNAVLQSAERLHEVYSAWLDMLPWEHADHMLSRGISMEDQARHGYKSYTLDPLETCRRVQELVKRVGIPAGVPGFYPAKKTWTFGSRRGIFIPVRDRDGNIVALKCRQLGDDFRYRFVTSVYRPGGASPGGPAHWAYPAEVRRPDITVVTEGEIKANITADILKVPVVSVPGVSNWKQALPVPTEKVLVCYDYDTKPGTVKTVKRHKKALVEYLIINGHRVWVGFWSGHKGIDDALVAEAKITWTSVK